MPIPGTRVRVTGSLWWHSNYQILVDLFLKGDFTISRGNGEIELIQ